MFEDCGWEYLTEFDGYNYFRKPADKMQQKEERSIISDRQDQLYQDVTDGYKDAVKIKLMRMSGRK